ncbi:MAG: hypothetical protein JWQ27_2146 [Ferruginibacter sp.]|nr:hypothetical protein [Ferruginibacter sp.]
MAGIFVQFVISWLVIWLYNKGSLSVLGLKPDSRRTLDFFIHFFLTAVCCASGVLAKKIIAGQPWQVNPAFDGALLWNGIWWNIKSVLFEELVFRGVMLYILLKKLGAKKAIIISAIAFGIYHWFSLGAFGNPMQMIIVFLSTGAMGFVLAYAYSKTGSLFIPIGIHLGWNFTQIFIFSQGPIGNGLFIQSPVWPFRTDSIILFLIVTFLTTLAALLLNYLLVKRRTANRKEAILPDKSGQNQLSRQIST